MDKKQYERLHISRVDTGDVVSGDNGRTWVTVADIIFNPQTDTYTLVASNPRNNIVGRHNRFVTRRTQGGA